MIRWRETLLEDRCRRVSNLYIFIKSHLVVSVVSEVGQIGGFVHTSIMSSFFITLLSSDVGNITRWLFHSSMSSFFSLRIDSRPHVCRYQLSCVRAHALRVCMCERSLIMHSNWWTCLCLFNRQNFMNEMVDGWWMNGWPLLQKVLDFKKKDILCLIREHSIIGSHYFISFCNDVCVEIWLKILESWFSQFTIISVCLCDVLKLFILSLKMLINLIN